MSHSSTHISLDKRCAQLYNFLTRSRSRSRSKNDPLEHHTDMPDPLHTSPSSKPASRITSRPISSTTATTNTTVTPGTPKQRKYAPLVKPPASPLSNSHSSSRPTTPKSSATRQKLNDLLDLALGRKSSSRSRSRSRPNSPQPSLDVPPLPTQDDDITPRPRKSFSPGRASRPRSPSSPSPTPKVLRVMNPSHSNTSTTTTTGSIKLPKFFAARNPPSDNRHQSSSPPVLPPIPSIVSAPIKRVSSLHRRSAREQPDTDPPKLEHKLSSDSTGPPKITHTPPTPLKGTPSGSSSEANHTSSSSRLAYHAMKGSLDSGYRHRNTPMTILDEEGRLDTRKSVEPESILPVPRTGLKMSSATRATKHGSFDFERPGWSAIGMQRAGSNGTTTTATSGWSRTGEGGLSKERESTYGPGLAGVGTLQREMSVKRAEEREEALRARERAKKHRMDATAPDKERTREKTKLSSSHRTTPSDQVHASTSTAGTGKSSSMSKSTGKKAFKTASGSGISRLAGLTAHGLFSFEPPVPSPTRSSGSTGTVHEVPIPWGKPEKEKERLLAEKERQKDRKSLHHRGDRPPVPVPKSSTNAGHRSGTKGRSLDLGLGLAWAPSKVREDALLPSSTFFTRSLSNSNSSVGGRSASGSTTGRSGSSVGHHSGNGNTTKADRSKLGREVAEVFRNALDAEGYATFKTYVHQFDAHKIPFDGPTGIVTRVRRLLASAPGLDEDAKKLLLENFIGIILQQA